MNKVTLEVIFLSCMVAIINCQLSVIHPRPYLSAAHLLASSSIERANVRELKGLNLHRQLRQEPDAEHLENFSDNIDREDNMALPSTNRLSISNEYGERVPAPFDSTTISTFDTSVNQQQQQQQQLTPATSNRKSTVNVNTIRLIDPFKQPDPYEISPDPLIDNFNSNYDQDSNKTERKFSTRNGVYSLKEQSFFAASEQDNTFAPSENNNREDEDPVNTNDNNSGNGLGGYSESVQSASTDNQERDDNFVLNKLTSSDTRKKRLNQCVQTCIDDAFDLFRK